VSYDLLLYDRNFVRGALEQSLGDWTAAPLLTDAAREVLLAGVASAGFVERQVDPGFVAFARSQGHKVGREFFLSGADRVAQFTLFGSSGAFAVPPGAVSAESVAFCIALARSMADEAQLGFFDPQTGDAHF
jgi:hypothetical protein